MRDLEGKKAVITGGGSGIGRALALTCAAAGMDVAVADINLADAEAVAAEVSAAGRVGIALRCDVSDRADVGRLADTAFAEPGRVHLLCNNAGVVTTRPAHQLSDADWNWVLGVDLYGVLHGIQAFLPRLVAAGGEAHILNTASIAGLVPNATPNIVPYVTAKYAVVGLTESLRPELAPLGIGVSVLCPGPAHTQIGASARNRPAQFGGPQPLAGRDATRAAPTAGAATTRPLPRALDPLAVAAMALTAVRDNELYVMTHPEYRDLELAERFSAIRAACDRAGRVAAGGA